MPDAVTEVPRVARPRAVLAASRASVRKAVPGVALCAALTAAAYALQWGERRVAGQAWLEAVVLAIFVGAAVRAVWTPGARYRAGIGASAKTLLEIAIVLLGASVSVPMLLRAGPAIVAGIVATVVLGIATSYLISRMLGLRHRLAMLVACGNSICGNSAIVAVAPVIGAEPHDVASAVGFSALLGVVMVLGLPALTHALGLTHFQHGVVAGLTVYALPQVLAATLPVSALSAQVGTLVKLVRILMLGPVVVALSLHARRAAVRGSGAKGRRLSAARLVPWFIIGFLVVAVLRAAGAVPNAAMPPITSLTAVLTVMSMAALGLSVDVRVLARVGVATTTAVIGSLGVLVGISLTLIRVLHIG